MKVVGTDGRTYQWKLNGKIPELNDNDHRSAGHLRARILLRELFPFESRLEEVSLPGSGGLAADFVLLQSKLIVEVHGRQHYQFVERFHKTRFGFLRAQQRDGIKRDWAERNGFVYCELPDTESDREWQVRIEKAQHPAASDEDE